MFTYDRQRAVARETMLAELEAWAEQRLDDGRQAEPNAWAAAEAVSRLGRAAGQEVSR